MNPVRSSSNSTISDGALPIGAGCLANLEALVRLVINWLVAFVRTPERLIEFSRYVAVSALALGLDLVTFVGLVSLDVMSTALTGAISCLVGLGLHYVLSVNHVFDATVTGKSNRQLAGEYILTGLLGFAITAFVIWAIIELTALPVWFAKAVAVGATFITVYVIRSRIVFAAKADAQGRRIQPTEPAAPSNPET